MRDAANEGVAHQVRLARAAGVAWSEVAEITGVSKPTAISRWDEPVTEAAAIWDYEVGARIRRREIHDRFGGNRQSGISPSTRVPEIFLFTGNHGVFGYADEAFDDGRFRYSGEGLNRDQQLSRGNKAIAEHQENGQHLRLLESQGDGVVVYLGEYEYAGHTWVTANDPATQAPVKKIEFDLHRIGDK